MSSLMAVEGLLRTRAVAGDVPSFRPAEVPCIRAFSVVSRQSSFLSHTKGPHLSHVGSSFPSGCPYTCQEDRVKNYH